MRPLQSGEGSIVISYYIGLDSFSRCGTALVAAQTLKRQWIGIDISPTACRVGQTLTRRLRPAGKRTALARRTRVRRPRPAVDE